MSAYLDRKLARQENARVDEARNGWKKRVYAKARARGLTDSEAWAEVREIALELEIVRGESKWGSFC